MIASQCADAGAAVHVAPRQGTAVGGVSPIARHCPLASASAASINRGTAGSSHAPSVGHISAHSAPAGSRVKL
jgi:hypothetical protein